MPAGRDFVGGLVGFFSLQLLFVCNHIFLSLETSMKSDFGFVSDLIFVLNIKFLKGIFGTLK